MTSLLRHLDIKHYVILPIALFYKFIAKYGIKLLTHGTVTGILFGGSFLMYCLYVNSVEMHFFQLHMNGQNISSVCLLPKYDPFDPSVRPFLHSWHPVNCGNHHPYLTYVDTSGFIRLNLSGIKESGYNETDYECRFAEIERCKENDYEAQLTPFRILRGAEKLHRPFVMARCNMVSSGLMVYKTVHAYVVPPSPSLIERTKKFRPGSPSVLIFGLDSMSRLNFIRQLPKTYKFLISEMDSVVFAGLTKVGDNTFPNILTMLSGLAVVRKPGIEVPSWKEMTYMQSLDNLRLAWKQYSEEGYITMYAEDQPRISGFNLAEKGFIHPPTDYYMRPFWLAMETARNENTSDSRCYGNIPKHHYLFNYTEQFIMRMRKYPYFAFSFLTQYSHDHINSVQVIDGSVKEMFQNLHRGGYLEDTVVIVMGDHGNRLESKFRQTVIGRIEDRMPFLAISLPKKLKQQYPHLRKNLQANSRVLLSWYDVYELLIDIAKNNLNLESTVKRWGVIGYSLFRPVPINRTCLQAGIPREYCVCAYEKSISINNPAIVEAAHDLINYVNQLLATDDGKLCLPLTLSGVTSAQLLLPESRPHEFMVTYRVTVEVAPSGGLLEGTLEKGAWDKVNRVVGDVNRINLYGNQSHCTESKILKLYCYCSDLI